MFESETYRYVFTLKDEAGDGLYNRQAASVKVVDYYNPGTLDNISDTISNDISFETFLLLCSYFIYDRYTR